MEPGAAKNAGLITLCSVLALVIGGGVVYFSMRGREPTLPIIVSTPQPTATLPPSPTPAPIRVYITGAVENPDVCELPHGSIVRDAIEAAGGAAADADLARVNLALEVQDQQHVHVPRLGEENPLPVVSGGISEESTTGLININAATANELEALPGIGEVMAQRIVAYREANGPFQVIEEIQGVPGIGLKTFEGLREWITVGP